MISFLRRNLAWILLSLMLSIALWVVVTFQENPERVDVVSNVAITIQGKPNTVLVQPDVTAVQVEVSAPSDVWPLLRADRFRAVVDASKVSPGAQEVPVTVVSTDPRARVQSWDPQKITLRVDPVRSKAVPVQVVSQGAVPFGYEAGTIVVTPTEVTVSGPQSSVDQVAAVVVEVGLDGVTRTIDRTYRPVPETATGVPVDHVDIAPESVFVQVPVEQKLGYKTVPVQPNLQGNVALGYQLLGFLVDPDSVTLVGDPKTLNQLQVVSTQPINVDDLRSDREVTTDLALPGTVALKQAQSIVVRVRVAPIDGSKTVVVSPRIINGAPGVTYNVSPGAVNVTLTGPVPVLTTIGPDDVPVVVDVRGAITGTQSVATQVTTVPSLLHLVGIQPPTVVVTVK